MRCGISADCCRCVDPFGFSYCSLILLGARMELRSNAAVSNPFSESIASSVCDCIVPFSSSVLISIGTGNPRNMRSTAVPTSSCTPTRLRSRISTTTSKVGVCFLSNTVFWVRLRLASMSPSVTDCVPPTKSARVGLLMTFPNVFPCAVATSCTPRSAMVRAAIASSSVPISSMTTTSGMWFSTASIITRCCSSVFGTCILLARPIAGCGTAPSPAISFEVSTMTTLLDASSASTLATSRRMVVFPTPGLPSMSTLLLLSMRFWMSFTLPNTALPTLQVSPTGSPSRSRITENRCRVRSMPALLSSPNLPSPERT